MIKKRGGRPRNHKKQSPTVKFISINKEYFATGNKPDWRKIKNVNGF